MRVWGFLASGVLHVHVLGEGETMDKYVYSEMVEDHLDEWRGGCEHLVCDHERVLHTEEALLALKVANSKLVDFPKCSQDFNAIENVWAILKECLAGSQPIALEHRDEFVKRLESAARWANKHRADQVWHLSTNQVERADA